MGRCGRGDVKAEKVRWKGGGRCSEETCRGVVWFQGDFKYVIITREGRLRLMV